MATAGANGGGVVDDLLVARLARIARALAITCVTIAGLVLASWLLGVGDLHAIHPAFAAMKANTAIGLAFVGAALLVGHTRPGARALLSAVPVLLGALTLLQYLAGLDLGIDDLFVRQPSTMPDPARMAPMTAGALLALGAGVALLDRRRVGSTLPAQLFALLATLAALLSLFGYLYGAPAFYRIGSFSAMSAHSAVALIAASFAILFERPTEGLMRYLTGSSPSGTLARRLLPAIVLVPAIFGWLRLRGQRAGFYGLEFGVAAFVVANIVAFAALTWWTAASLFRAEAEQRKSAAELAAAAGRVAILAETSRQFAESRDLPGLLGLIARRLSEQLGELCSIRLVSNDPDWFEPSTIVHHPDPEMLAFARGLSAPGRTNEGITGKVVATGEPLLLTDLRQDDVAAGTHERYRSLVQRLRVSSILGVPLRGRQRLLGVISMTRSDPQRPFTADDLALVQDLADRAALTIENLRLLGELEDRVAERTRALEEVNRELESFSYSVAHDLRAPLRGISGFSSALLEDLEGKLTPQDADHLNRIVSASTHMGQIIDALLGLSRVTRSELRRDRVDLGAIAREIVADLVAADPTRQVEVVIADGLDAQGDPSLLRALLLNLIGNAWKFTGKRPHAHIAIGREPAEPPVYFVRDDGAGFDMARGERLFAPFRRLHRSAEFEGFGIGLATVQRIVRRHGGRVWAEAATDQGATFRFTLAAPPTRAADLVP